MEKGKRNILNESFHRLQLMHRIIPTLERNVALLKTKGTEKWQFLGTVMSRSRITLEKIEDMLDRCQITTKRCTRLLHMGKERYGNRDDTSFLVSSTRYCGGKRLIMWVAHQKNKGSESTYKQYCNKDSYKTISLNNLYCEHKQVDSFIDTFIRREVSFWCWQEQCCNLQQGQSDP